MFLDEIIEANHRFTALVQPKVISHKPQKHVAVVTCMDTRLVEILEPALGIRRGDVVEIKNAGNTVVEGCGDVIRSLVGAVYLLGVQEIAVIGHTNCGMANVDTNALAARMRAAGVSEAAIGELDLPRWIGTFANETANVIQTVEHIKNSPYLPKDIPVHGLMVDIGTEELTILVNGSEK